MSLSQDISFLQKIPYNTSFDIATYYGKWFERVEAAISQLEHTVAANTTTPETHTIQLDSGPSKFFAITGIVFESSSAAADNAFAALTTTTLRQTYFKVDGASTKVEYKAGAFRLEAGKVITIDLATTPIILSNTDTATLLFSNFDTTNSVTIRTHIAYEILRRLENDELLKIFPYARRG